ncbi:MAG: formyltetrahydrofolate deformylase [Acidobacteria bacterium]|nr:formyltetrahydrofolate deformylase [Acidobacteriota bacterium]
MNDSAVLLITCPDQKGLVAAVSGELYRFGANIIHADQHQDHDAGLFFMRVEWALGSESKQAFDIQAFSEAFAPIAKRYNMDSQLHVSAIRPRVAVFVSQHLHCFADLLHRHQMGELECDIALAISNHTDGEALAKFYGIPFHHVPLAAANKAEGEARQFGLLEAAGVELIVLARYMQILSPEFVRRYPSGVINVHHSFLPAFIGARPYHAAHKRGVKLIGATSHYVTEELDDGPIIEQDVARVSHRDQVEDLIAKGRDLERVVLSRAVKWHLDRRILRYGNKTVIFD